MPGIKLGVAGYLLKDASSAEVISVVRAVHIGGAVCPPKLCGELFRILSNLCGQSLEFSLTKDGVSNIWELKLTDGPAKQVKFQIGFDLSPVFVTAGTSALISW